MLKVQAIGIANFTVLLSTITKDIGSGIFSSLNLDTDGSSFQLQLRPFDRGAHIAQTTTALRVANIAGALAALRTLCHSPNHGALPTVQQFGADRARRMTEAIADEDIIVIWVLLMHQHSQIRFGQRLLAVKREVDDRTVINAAEPIATGTNVVQADVDHSLDRLRVHTFAFCATDGTVLDARGAL